MIRFRRLTTALVIVSLVCWAGNASAKTTIQGGQLGNTTWTQAGSPYVVEGDVVISKGKTLTIRKGVTVRFEASDFLKTGRDNSRVEVRIAGSLDVAGNSSDPVVMKGSSQSRGHWFGVVLESTASKVDIDHLHVRDAEDGLIVESTNSVEVSYSKMWHHADEGIEIQAGTPTVDAVELYDNNGPGIGFFGEGGGTLTNAVVRSNTNHGVSVDCTNAQQPNVRIHSSVVYGNGSDGVSGFCDSMSKNITVRNTVVANNRDDGVDRNDSNPITVEYNNVWGNGDENYEGNLQRGNNISARPLFQNPPKDFRLQQTSLCIDEGTKASAPDHDFDGKPRPLDGDSSMGPQYDIGAFEFGMSSICGNGTVESGEECDDGNRRSGDGCSADCDLEMPAGDAGMDADASDVGAGDGGMSDGGDAGVGGDADVGTGDAGDDVDAGDVDGSDAIADTGDDRGDISDGDAADGGDAGTDGTDDGCGCASGDGRLPGNSLVLGLVIAGIALRRRRRRRE